MAALHAFTSMFALVLLTAVTVAASPHGALLFQRYALGQAIDQGCTTSGLSISITAKLDVQDEPLAAVAHHGSAIIYSVTKVSLPSETDCPVTDGDATIVTPDGVASLLATGIMLGGDEPRSKVVAGSVHYASDHEHEISVPQAVWRATATINAIRHLSSGADGPASASVTWDTLALHPSISVVKNCTSYVAPDGRIDVWATVTNSGDTALAIEVTDDKTGGALAGPSSLEPGGVGVFTGNYTAPPSVGSTIDTVTVTGIDVIGGEYGTVRDTDGCVTEVATTTTSIPTSTSTTTTIPSTTTSSSTTMTTTTITSTTTTTPTTTTTQPPPTATPSSTPALPTPTASVSASATPPPNQSMSGLDIASVGLIVGVAATMVAVAIVALRLRRSGPFAK